MQHCPDCSGECDRIWINPPTFSFKEGNNFISSKNDKYWDHAEEHRLAKQKKAKAEEKERMAYDEGYRNNKELAIHRLASQE